MEQPSLVASDVDGTLVTPLERATSRTVAVVGRVVAAGIPFVLATGRPPRFIPPIVDQFGVPGICVCANGAVIYDAQTDQVLHASALSADQVGLAVRAIDKAVEGARFSVERATVGQSAMQSVFYAEPDYVHAWAQPDWATIPRVELLAAPAVKLLVRQPELDSEVLAQAVRGVLGDEVQVTYSAQGGLIELGVAGTSKASGLALVARERDVDPHEVVAFGDMPNDLEMLQWAGHGVAMDNAHPAVKAVADEITGPNSEDGVALVLERWF